jgi:hypothetical protein
MEEENDDDIFSITHNPKKMLRILHDPLYLIADSYTLFERILDLGIKNLYFKEDPNE